MKTVDVHEVKAHFSRLLERAHAGEEIVIAKNRKPYARLVPVTTRVPKRRAGTLKGLIHLDEAFVEPLPQGWNGEE